MLGSVDVPHASMRACRLVPLPEIRTVMLYLGCAMVPVLREQDRIIVRRK